MTNSNFTSITQKGRWIPTKADYQEIYQKMPKRIDRWKLMRRLKKRTWCLKKSKNEPNAEEILLLFERLKQ